MRPDIVFVDKKSKEVKIIDIAVPGDSRVTEKELEKIEKYQMLREEIGHAWQINKVTVIPVVIGALGVISDKFERYMEKLDVKIATEIIQKGIAWNSDDTSKSFVSSEQQEKEL